ncbi:EamA family transporter [Agrobacterium vitis]|uniref:EamA family transporter n=1 Tax=Agrobacterium vitis TaxID=373 RepID=A0AAE4WEK4_AGRVI|nr:EamA family transporter [Agrobacterium vitis]MCF1500011.1 EamA family transporter [Allorhizobium sp. Av2]MCM2442304.1 EamA family transporter [Agrobacterium vitis]MUZ58714.1 EamA family transporter [Agrobacterium vitis]MVA66349.1 EamA family transporter [Agrobacterium vitis]MVA88386.1 EamA family transporter [Agrobacterium vitis]
MLVKVALPYLSVIVYCICTAVSAVWISFAFSNISGSAVTLFAFIVSFAVFTGIQKYLHGDVFRLVRQYPFKVLLLNIFTLFSWLFAFQSLYHIEPSIECAVFQGFLPIAVLFADFASGRAKVRSMRAAGISMIAISLSGLILMRFVEGRGMMDFSFAQLLQGVALASIAGISAGLHAFFSADLYKVAKCTTLEILCNRFFLLLVVTSFFGGPDLMQAFTVEPMTIVRLLALSAISVLIPMFTLQYSVQTMGAARVSIITPAVPVIALILEQVLGGWPSVFIPMLVGMVCVSIGLTNYWVYRKNFNFNLLNRLFKRGKWRAVNTQPLDNEFLHEAKPTLSQAAKVKPNAP